MNATEDLAPEVGTAAACRAMGVSRATVYRRRKPRPAGLGRSSPAPAASGARRRRTSRRFSTCCTRRGSSTTRRRVSTRRYWTKGRTTVRSARCTASCTMPVKSANAAISFGIRNTRSPSYWPPAPNQVWSWDITKLLGAGQVDLLLPVRDPRHLQPLRGGLDACLVRKCRPGQAADSRHDREGECRRGGTDHPQRSRPGDEVAHGCPIDGHVGRDQVAQPTARFQRQPVLREPVQDAQVPTRVPGAIRLAAGRSHAVSVGGSSAGTTTSTITRGLALLTPAMVHHGQSETDPCCTARRAPRRLHRPPGAFRPEASLTDCVARGRVDQPAAVVVREPRKRASENRRFPEARCTFGAPSIRLSLVELRPRRARFRFTGHRHA